MSPKRTFKQCADDDPAWWGDADFISMTPKERATFRNNAKRQKVEVLKQQQRENDLLPFPGELPPPRVLHRLLTKVVHSLPILETIKTLTALASVQREIESAKAMK